MTNQTNTTAVKVNLYTYECDESIEPQIGDFFIQKYSAGKESGYKPILRKRVNEKDSVKTDFLHDFARKNGYYPYCVENKEYIKKDLPENFGKIINTDNPLIKSLIKV